MNSRVKEKTIFKRSQADIDAVAESVRNWINRIRAEGDSAILEYVRMFDTPNFLKRIFEYLPTIFKKHIKCWLQKQWKS